MSRLKMLVFAAVASGSLAVFAQVPAQSERMQAKYGPDAVPITQDNEYLRTHDAPDYWTLNPYYVAQETGAACSVASVAMMINALRGLPMHASEQLVTQMSVLDAVGDENWKAATAESGEGVSFTELVGYVRRSLAAFGLRAEIEVFRPRDNSPRTLAELRRILTENERSAEDIILLAFDQGTLTGDVTVGHIAPLGAYDSARRRVLVMDVDRSWYVPYWSSDERLLEAMLKPDHADPGGSGLIRVRVRQNAGWGFAASVNGDSNFRR
ncbi:phytochelatin synthase family protein [Azospirillum sp. sgz301742]